MKRLGLLLLVLVVSTLPAAMGRAAGVQRFALVAGANDGGPERPELRYALSDAQRFARVLVELGGVNPLNASLLDQPSRSQMESAMTDLRRRVVEANRVAQSEEAGRTEVIVYFSGHADETGLRLGSERYSYRTLRDRLDEIPADVRIAVLDACASGAFTRLKGGRLQQPFLVDESTEMRGHVFLTSSAETEAAQESDLIQSSYFTHYLISGLRGAADANGEGKVTLNEAYQFAFNETLGKTLETTGGAQHPSYDINLSGTGDVVITDLRETSASLILDKTIEGRFFIRNAGQELVVELYKPAGRRVELGLEPGKYEVRVERDSAALVARAEVAEGSHLELEGPEFVPTSPEVTRPRGHEGRPVHSVAGRNRIALRFGMWRGPDEESSAVVAGVSAANTLAGLQYTRYLSEASAVTLGSSALGGEAGAKVSTQGVFSGSWDVTAAFLGIQWNPTRGDLTTRAMRPFLALGLGPVVGSTSGSTVDWDGVRAGDETQVTAGGIVGGGVEVLLSRRWSIGLDAGYLWMDDFPHPVGERSDYSGFELALNFGMLFGRGYGPGSR